MPGPSKSVKIYEDLKNRMESGHLAYGTLLPAERQLSQQYGVQRDTLRKALQALKEEGYLSSVPGSGTKVIYQRPKEETSSRLIAFIISGDMDRQAQLYHIQVCNYLEDLFRPLNINVLFAKLGSDAQMPPLLTRAGRVDGIIWVSHIEERFLEEAQRAGIPCLCLASDSTLFPRINYEDFVAGFDATQHLLEQGARRIAFIGGIHGSVTQERQRGYMEALATYGIQPEKQWIIEGDWSYTAGELAARALLKVDPPIDAVLGSNDMTAIGALKTFIAAGRKVPEDIRIVGIDNIDEGKSCVPALTTIAVSQRDIARTAYLLMQELLEGRPVPDEIIIPGRLIRREST